VGSPLVILKLVIVLAILTGIFVLVGLGRVTFQEGVSGGVMLTSALIVALGLQGAARTLGDSKGDGP